MRTKKSFLNLISDVIPQVMIALVSFVRVKVFLKIIGNEILGVYQLFGQILAYLSLAELGLTDIVMHYLYKPISENNRKKIDSILSGVKKSFYIVMVIMILLGIIVAPNIRFLIKSNSLSNVFIIIAFILTLLINVLSYFSTPYMVMFNADQNKYKYSIYTQSLLLLRNLFVIGAIYIFKDLYAILIIEIMFTIIQDIVVKYLFNKNYKWVNFKEKPDFSFWKKTKSLVPHKIGGLIAYNIDVIIVSKFLGLVQVVIYNAYYTITNMISNIIGKFSGASLASIGNLLVVDKKKSYNVFLEYNDLLFFVATIICVPILSLISPFVNIWYGSEYVVNFLAVFLFVFNLFYNTIRIVLNTYASAAALYKETLVCTWSEAAINLTMSLILVQKMGISGLLLGTSVSLIISEFSIKPFILNKNIFNDKISKYYRNCLLMFIILALNSALLYFLMSKITIPNLLIWFLIGIGSFIINFVVTMCEYKFIKRCTFYDRIMNLFRKVKKA